MGLRTRSTAACARTSDAPLRSGQWLFTTHTRPSVTPSPSRPNDWSAFDSGAWRGASEPVSTPEHDSRSLRSRELPDRG